MLTIRALSQVAAVDSLDFVLDAEIPEKTIFNDIPISVELLLTTNSISLLETENPQHQAVVEISPLNVILSEKRLELLSNISSSLQFGPSDDGVQTKRRVKPDPPRIEILSRRILRSIDLSCDAVKLAVVKDIKSEGLSLKHKEIVMEECLSDFLSVVSCFDFSLPNEEALSSAMQISIGRLVGIGLTDDEAWGCTNAARLNFLDGIALMKRAQSDVLVQLSGSMRNQTVPRSSDENFEDLGSMEDFEEVSVSSGGDSSSSSDSEINSEDEEDDASADSADIVDTTLGNAVEKTLATFSQLLNPDDFMAAEPIVVVELPLGLRLSIVKLFYDKYLTSSIPSLVITNSVGIELLTIVPASPDDSGSKSYDFDEVTGQGISFSRFDLDKDHGFGEGGAPMSILASDEGAENDRIFRDTARFDETALSEVEILFSYKIFDELIDEFAKLKSKKAKNGNASKSQDSGDNQQFSRRPQIDTSAIITSRCLSVLMTSDELVPFTRLTIEDFSFRNQKASISERVRDKPSWSVIAASVSLENLSPEGQFYPQAVTLLDPNAPAAIPFQLRYYKSPDPWKVSNRLVIDFRGYRVHLVRQYLNELIHYLISDRFGVGKLKKKHSTDQRDIYGNQKPPLLYSVNFMDCSVVLPRSSSSSDMVAFEVGKVSIAVSYIPETFAMPTESTPFEPSPSSTEETASRDDIQSRQSFMSDSEDYENVLSADGASDIEKDGPVSSFTRNLKRRLTIKLEKMRVFTAMAPNAQSRTAVESPLFRFFHELDGRAEAGKLVYRKTKSSVRQPSTDSEWNVDDVLLEQVWQEMSTNLLNLEVLADWAPHMRLLIGDWEGPLPFSLNARLSQFCLLLSVWYDNMQEFPAMFPNARTQVKENSTPPKIPTDFPKYATEEFVSMLEDMSVKKSEICCLFKQLKLRCTFDPPGYFDKDPECFQYFENPYLPDEEKPGIVVTVSDATVHVIGDFLNIKRIGVGSSGLELIDERRAPPFQRVLSTDWSNTSATHGSKLRPSPAWADIAWGLRTDVRTLGESLPMPFMVTCFMTPEWALINVGGESIDAIMFELSWIWVFLGYFKSFFKEPEFGNPGHQAERWVHRVKNSLRKSYGEAPVGFEPGPGISVDFRLWLCRPILSLPSDYHSTLSPSLRINCKTGLWYRYKSIDEFSSQEVATTDINLYFVNEFEDPRNCRKGDPRNSMSGIRPVIEGLSFGLRYDCNNAVNHKDITVQIPFAGEKVPPCSITGGELEVAPIILEPPTVCTPFQSLERSLGPKVCEITCIIEVLPVTSATMMNFFRGPANKNEEFVPVEIDRGPATISVSAQVGDIRVFAIDPILGVQLPVAALSLRTVRITLSKYSIEQGGDIPRGDAPPGDFQVAIDSHLWADYFKLGITRSWEPLIEPFKCILLRETSERRGQGFSLDADCPFHVNLTGAFLQNLNEIIESFSRVVGETFGEGSELKRNELLAKASPSKDRVGAIIEDKIKISKSLEIQVLHEIPKPLKSEDRVAFSLRNLTGQKVRIHQQSDDSSSGVLGEKPSTVTYLNEFESMGLTFAATISVIKNLSIVEVPYPGLPDSTSGNWNKGSLKHAVDVQVPGFRWLEGIKVDTFGRKFEPLIPRSPDVLSKVYRDWRLKNTLMLLTEVGLDSGGRLVTVRSLFEIRNDTTHRIKLVFNPDPTHEPANGVIEKTGFSAALDGMSDDVKDSQQSGAVEEIATAEPGEVLQVPTLLLEKALRLTGSHLGSFWICPEIEDQDSAFVRSFKPGSENSDAGLTVGFCSRPVQLAKLVHESALIFEDGGGADMPVDKAKSGVQVSCPTRVGESGDTDAPFCYAIEVVRSPLVNINRERSVIDTSSKKEGDQKDTEASGKKSSRKSSAVIKKLSKKEKIHGPVAYTLSVHAPLVVVNLLPEGGRFELMHAVRKTVLWYADLQPGQQIPVHSVGLDAPLLLLVNLGFCRTPVGEGALVHHGVEVKASAKGMFSALVSFFSLSSISGRYIYHLTDENFHFLF
jgi:hypothetical protein